MGSGPICLGTKSVETKENSRPNRINNSQIITLSRSLTRGDVSEIKLFKKALIDLHNELRKKHNSTNLKENKELNYLADEFAMNYLLNQRNQMNIYDGKYYGENIMISDSKDPKIIFKKWSKESENYDFNKNHFERNALHFTQIIWKETNEIGIGIANDVENKKYCVVTLYYIPGNTLGEFQKNVNNEIN